MLGSLVRPPDMIESVESLEREPGGELDPANGLDLLNRLHCANLKEGGARDALGAVFSILREVFPYDVAILALPRRGAWRLVTVHARGTSKSFLDECLRETELILTRDQGFERTAHEVEHDSLLGSHAPPQASSPASLLAFPLMFEPKAGHAGLLAFHGADQDRFTTEHTDLLVRLGAGLSIAFLNTDLLLQLERQAKVDEVTGLYNRHAFKEFLMAELRRQIRYGQPLSLVMLDIDHFKSVNDRYGHQVGDQVLEQVARELMEEKRAVDVVARWGGEEFAVILPETGREGARQVAERMRLNVEEKVVLPDRRVTVSLGVATQTQRPGTTMSMGPALDTLLPAMSTDLEKRADRALYQAKESGRNRVVTG